MQIRKREKTYYLDDDVVIVSASAGKGKNKAEDDGYTIVGGAGRCTSCVRDDACCEANFGAIERWERDVADGKVFVRGPPGTNCKRCQEKKKRCELPATAELRRALGAKSAAISIADSGASRASRASGRKRKEVFAGVEMPPTKRAKVAEAEGQFQAELLEVLRGIRVELGRMAVAAERTADATEKTVTALVAQARAVGGLRDHFATEFGELPDAVDLQVAAYEGGDTPRSAVDVTKAAGTPGAAAEVPKSAAGDDKMEGGSGVGGKDEEE
jgi:hypothetical protein